MLRFILCLLILIINNQNFVKNNKIWIDSTSDLMNKTNWENGYAPCDYDQIIFPELYQAALILSKNLVADSLVLPKEGVIIFGDKTNSESTIALTNGIKKDETKAKKCIIRNNLAKLKFPSDSTKFWFDPQNWKSSEKVNSGTPDLEKIPCAYDTVIMPDNGSLSINFEYIESLEVSGIEMGGVNTTWKIFQNDLYSDIAHIIFKEADDFNVIFNNILDKNNYCTCHSPGFYNEYEKKVCSHVKEQCNKNYPKCLEPIKPYGHCCEICGSVLKIITEDCTAFDLKLFNELIEKEIKQQGMEEYLDYYTSKIYDGNLYYVQLIILDKNDYNELSVNFMNNFNKSILREAYSTNSKIFQLSGMSYDKNNPEHFWKYVILPLLCTTLFFALTYVYYVRGSVYLPSWLYQNRLGLFNSSFVFARFDNNQGELEITENRPPIRIEALNENLNEDIVLSADVSCSFDNPMFEEKLEVPISSQNIENLSIASDSTELTMICLDDNN